MTPTPLISAPASIPGGTTYESLAYVDAYDAVLDCDYAFVAYKETEANGDWRVRIQSSQTAGGVFEPAMMASNARSTGARGEPWFPWGYSLDPGPGESRQVQFRVYVTDSRPSEVEIFLQLRKADGTPDAPRSVRFAWPA